MAKFALILPREELVEPAGRIARELGMEVVLNKSVATEHVLELIEAFQYFEPIDPELVARDSLLREFIGGGSYHY